MQKFVFVLACLVCVGYGRRVQSLPSTDLEGSKNAFTKLLLSSTPAAAFNPQPVMGNPVHGTSRQALNMQSRRGNVISQEEEPEGGLVVDYAMDPEKEAAQDGKGTWVPEAVRDLSDVLAKSIETDSWWNEEQKSYDEMTDAEFAAHLESEKKKEKEEMDKLIESTVKYYESPGVIERLKSLKGANKYRAHQGDHFEFEDWMKEITDPAYEVKAGMSFTGKVTRFSKRGAEVRFDPPYSTEFGLLPNSLVEDEFGTTAENWFEVGESMRFEVIATPGHDENPTGVNLIAWTGDGQKDVDPMDQLQEYDENDEAFEVTVVSVPQFGSGITTHFRGIECYLPVNRLVGSVQTLKPGDKLLVKITELDPDEEEVTVSNREAVAEESSVGELKIGQVVSGVVQAIKPFGVFVDCGGTVGLMHISQISMDHTENVEFVFPVGAQIKAMVINIDNESNRIALSTKTLEPEPGDMLRDPQLVYDKAEETAAKYQEQMEAERKAREEAAQEILFGLESVFTDMNPEK